MSWNHSTTISIINFTMNNIYIHHISLTNASAENQNSIFVPVEISHPLISPTVKLLDPSYAEEITAFQDLQDYTEIRNSLELTETRSLHKMCLKNASCHLWQKCRNIYVILCHISWLGHLHSCPRWKFSILPLKHTTLSSNHKTEGERKTMVLLPRLGQATS